MILRRPRRNRRTPSIRSLVQETVLHSSDFVAPFFVLEGTKRKEEIPSMPGVFRQSIDFILEESEKLHKKNIPAIGLFPVLDKSQKDPLGKESLNPLGIIPNAIRQIKKEIPSLCIICDIALDPYTSHGHDGLVSKDGSILNDETVDILGKMALLYAEQGVDIVAPSDMMDGRVLAIRKKLDIQGFHDVGILSYTAKYASSLYAPFREALGSSLRFGDKKTYQMNPANVKEALLEAQLDVDEGADMLMVKPALFYLDIIAKLKEAFPIPICAFHVSGEYAMVAHAHEKGIIDGPKVFYESLLSIKRAGADFIFTYAIHHILEAISG